MIPGVGSTPRYLTEEQMLARKRSTDAHRKAQAIPKRRHAANVALARIARASVKDES